MKNARKSGSAITLAIALTLVLSLLPFAAGAATVVDTTTLITTGSTGNGGDQWSGAPQITPDGSKIVFHSSATDLLATPTNSNGSIFLYDVTSDTIELITTGPLGMGGNDWSGGAQITPDGSKIVFNSNATDLLATPTNGNGNIFLYDVESGTIELITTGPLGMGGNIWSSDAQITPDGSKIVFGSYATDLLATPTNGNSNIFLYNVGTGITELITTGSGSGGNSWSANPQITPDGSKIVFSSRATDLLATPTNSNDNIFLYNVGTGITELITTGSGNGGNSRALHPQITDDGSKIVFSSQATDLLATPTNSNGNIFLYDVGTGITQLITTGPGSGGNNWSGSPQITPDGSKIVFNSRATNLTAIPTNGAVNLLLCDVATGITELITIGSSNGAEGGDAGGLVQDPSISTDGTKIAFWATATNLVTPPTSGRANIFLWQRTTYVDVTFDSQNGVDQPFTEAVPQGTAIAAPQAPTAPEGKVFAGWWTQAEGGTQWNFNNPVNNDMTLYAQWTTPQADMIEIFYAATEGGSVTLEEETIPATGTPVGSTAVADTGYDFIGWIGSTFASDEEFEAWLDWLESLEDPMDAIISTEAHLIPPANENGLWSDAGYIAIFIPTDEVPGGDGSTTPPMGDSTTLWSIAAVATLGCAAVVTALYRKRFEL